MKNIFFLILVTIAIASCQRIETGDSLDKKTITQLKKMGLLNENEKIIKYFSNFQKDKAGNFFTDKRIAHYWLDDHDKSKTEISYAFYQDIVSIDTTFNVHDFDIPYMTIKKRDNSSFNVYIDGTYEKENAFFREAISQWKKGKSMKQE